MRMWMIDPELPCNQHLLGEHFEIHKFKPSFEKKVSVKGRLFPVVQIDPLNMKARHDQLVEEMIRRGLNHNSPYEQPDVSYIKNVDKVKVNLDISIKDLCDRCGDCRRRIENARQNGILC